MVQAIFIIAALVTILGGIFWVLKNWEWIKNLLGEWTLRGIKVIYVWVSHDNQKTATLHLYLCGEEKSWLFPGLSDKNRDSYILAIKSIHYDPSYDSYSDRDWTEWMAQFVHPLSEKPDSYLVQFVDEYKFRLKFSSDTDEMIIVSDSFKLKTEMAECLKKYRIKYIKKAPEATGRWKIKNRYPVL
ncbi:MAG: hypothetical protein OXM61_00700 [Candidatus Poribacteria bacterium]|nr:hypothetical protein [Candidatus Poribacteria bacterium]MDE0313394.1 hypothetical protein [Candidatus Poribacteria bacterium]